MESFYSRSSTEKDVACSIFYKQNRGEKLKIPHAYKTEKKEKIN